MALVHVFPVLLLTDAVDDLAQRAATCQQCALSHSRQRVVFGSGPANSRLIVVGEAPGASEDEGGQPFVGRSGQLLFRLLAEETGLTRDDCYVTNVVKCRPPNNRPPTAREISACRPWLRAQQIELTGTVVLTLGNTATRAWLQTKRPIGELRGRAVRLDSFVVVPTLHPAAVLRGRTDSLEYLRADLRVVASLLAEATT